MQCLKQKADKKFDHVTDLYLSKEDEGAAKKKSP